MNKDYCLNISSYLEKNGLKVPLERVCDVFKSFYMNFEITFHDVTLSTLATVDFFLGRDIEKDIKRYYRISLIYRIRDLDMDLMISMLSCEKFLRFLSVYMRLFLNDLIKDLGYKPITISTIEDVIKFYKSKYDKHIEITIKSEASKEFTLALMSKLKRLSKAIKVEGIGYYKSDIDWALAFLGCKKQDVKGHVDDSPWKIEIERDLKIKLYNDKKLIGLYKVKRKGEYYVIERVSDEKMELK